MKKAGLIFEAEMKEAYTWAFQRYYNQNMEDANKFMFSSSKQEDVEEGTDFWDGEIRIDFTLDFKGKDHMTTIFPKTVVISRWFPEFQYGIRTGNTYKNVGYLFTHPVLVVGVTLIPSEFIRNRSFFMDCVYDNIQRIMETGEELYYTFQDEHPEMFA